MDTVSLFSGLVGVQKLGVQRTLIYCFPDTSFFKKVAA